MSYDTESLGRALRESLTDPLKALGIYFLLNPPKPPQDKAANQL
jgi:hypothetical protein